MITYDNILPDYFYSKLSNMEGKYAVDSNGGNYYRFTYPPYGIAIDFENIFLGVGIPHQCDVMYFSKRTEGMKTIYKQFEDPNLSLLIYFINEDYTGGELIYKQDTVASKSNKAVYFDSGIGIEFTAVTSGTQYLLISYFRKSPIKNLKTII
jgi:hypothetical protein